MKNILDLHTHTVLSNHGYSSLTENISAAQKMGLKYFGCSEHQPDVWGVGAVVDAFNALEHVPERIENLSFYKGCEFNILKDGSIDTANIETERLDYGIASMHYYSYPDGLDPYDNTNNYLKALDYGFIKILGHIHDAHYPCIYTKIVQMTFAKHKLIELNNSKLSYEGNKPNDKEAMKLLEICRDLRQPIIVDSDAHILYEVGHLEKAEKLLQMMEFPSELVLNYNEGLFLEYFPVKK